ncbi:MAG TPA: diguanylate cyclase [Pseudonocardiaceae bacterium]
MLARRRAGVWLWYLLAGALLTSCYYVAVASGAPPLVRVVLYCTASASAAVAVAWGCWRYRPQPLLPWLLLGLGQVVYSIADTTFYVTHYILQRTEYPAPADVFYLSHYLPVVAGLVLLIRLRTPGRDLPSLLDAAMLSVVAGMLSWVYLIVPRAQEQAPMLVKLASLAYPSMDLAMLVVSLRLILGPGRRSPSFVLLAYSLLAIFTADSLYVLQRLNETYIAGNMLDAIWLSGNLTLGAAALHPTMSQVGDATPTQDGPGLARFLALCAGVLVAPATLIVQYARGHLHDVPVIAIACAVLFLLSVARLALSVAQLRALAITDALTGLRTRRFFEAQLPIELARAQRSGRPFAVLILDVDRFKSINDRFGHPAGDRVLQVIAQRLSEVTRAGDVLARYGGEEFALLAPGVGGDGPAAVAQRLRERIASAPVMVIDGDGKEVALDVTVSVGTASYPLHGTTPADLVRVADRALYVAKSRGRNRVELGTAMPLPMADEEGLDYLRRVADEVDTWLSCHEHHRPVGRWAGMVAAELGLDARAVRCAETAGRLHDVGKLMVDRRIWVKPAPLTEDEWQQVRTHPEYGYRMIRVVPGLEDVAETVRQHHECFDGSGYPHGLAGTEIRIEARIVAVCDAWAAMRADRPYQPRLDVAEARARLVAGSGAQFDPEVVAAFLQLCDAGRLGELPPLEDQSASVFQNINS